MKSKYAIEKGKRFERFVAKEIEAEGLGKAGREGNSGAGFRKGDIASNLKFLLECKNEAQTNLLPNVDQAKDQAKKGNAWPSKWALITRDPRKPEFEEVYVTIDFWEFLRLLKTESEPKIKEPDRQMKYKMKRFLDYGKEFFKEFD